MSFELGYPDMALDDQMLDEYYKDVVVKEDDSYPEMIQRVQQWDMKRKFEKILEPTDFEDFRFNAPFVNAAFTQSKNRVSFPVGYLIPPGFDLKFPGLHELRRRGPRHRPRNDPRIRHQRRSARQVRKQGQLVGRRDQEAVRRAQRVHEEAVQRIRSPQDREIRERREHHLGEHRGQRRREGDLPGVSEVP
ncbi:hypothetical protein L596_027264 [Steinernema carpocapsae]|uniref:Peptidase M13 N-terminal domain-containing protein n=1 Tax=Steinernema carpocapsae TaxID=34508 RepID=A0A4U5M3S7_STECR|nr:hypothetical protein L596_027264 [Steinernema carpocapsae]